MFDDGYRYRCPLMSYPCLLINVTLNYTVDIILDKIYCGNLIKTSITKRSKQKVILDSCHKTVFSFITESLYQQIV